MADGNEEETAGPAPVFEADERPAGPAAADDFVLKLDSYEGPIDLLLDQARQQKVDLTQISILALADQYLAFIEQARRLKLELAAEYLVMAAYLAWLKSRLLLPVQADDEAPSGEELAETLAFRLRRLEAMRTAAGRLMARPRLGADVFARGQPEPMAPIARPVWQASLYDLLSAFADRYRRRRRAETALAVEASRLFSMDQALERMTALLHDVPDWATLSRFMPGGLDDPLTRRSATAATFTAALELCRAGRVRLRQEAVFGPLYLKRTGDGGQRD